MTGQEFKEMREAKGYTQRKLGELLNLTVTQISKIENDKVAEIKRSHIIAIKSLPKNKAK